MDKQQERRQDHFNKAYLGIIAQGRPSYVEGASCAYLTPDGAKCAVGHLLTEEELKLFGGLVGDVATLWRRMKNVGHADQDHPFNSDWEFYDKLQTVHDTLHDAEKENFIPFFKEKMKEVAVTYKLTVPDETATA